MWRIYEEHDASKALDKLPPQVLRNYEAWRAIVQLAGPQGLREVKSFHDEKLAGKLSSLRSSRLNRQWRVIYRIEKEEVTAVTVERITAHKY